MTLSPENLSPENIERFGPDPRERFAANLALVHRRIAAACEQVGRPIDSVRLLPITKTVPAEILRLAWAAGVTDFGENKLQEARDKAEAMADLSMRWHVVGHLQSNKVKYLTRLADEFHALDSLKLAEVLNKRLETDGRDMKVYVQVNTSGEASKYGLQPDETAAFLRQMPSFPSLRVRGLMTLALFSAEAARVRQCFVLLRTPVSAPISTRSGSLSRRYGRSCFCVSAARAGRTIAQLRCDFGASLDRPNTE